MPRENLARKVQRMVEVLKVLGHEIRMTVVLNTIESPNGIAASAAYPDHVKPPGRGPHKEKLELLLETERPSKIEDSIYSIPGHLRRPLQECIDAVDRLAQAKASKKEPQPHVIVTVSEDGRFLVDGDPVEAKKLASAIKNIIKSE